MLAVFGLILLLTIGAFIAAIVFVIRAAVERRKGADHGGALKHFYISLGTFAAGFVLLMVIAVFIPTPNATASTAPTAQRTKVTIASATPTPIPTARPTPTPKPTDNAALKNFRDNWDDIMKRTAYSLLALDKAREFISQGDLIDASDRLQKCADAASGINDDAAELNLDSGNDSDAALQDSIGKIGDGYGYGCKAMRKFMDTNAPSDGADAKDEFQTGSTAIDEAMLRAVVKYQLMGGNPKDLLDLRSAKREL
jgi:hypothetical protein